MRILLQMWLGNSDSFRAEVWWFLSERHTNFSAPKHQIHVDEIEETAELQNSYAAQVLENKEETEKIIMLNAVKEVTI